MTAFYFDKIENFLKKNNQEIVGILSEKQTRILDLNPKEISHANFKIKT